MKTTELAEHRKLNNTKYCFESTFERYLTISYTVFWKSTIKISVLDNNINGRYHNAFKNNTYINEKL